MPISRGKKKVKKGNFFYKQNPTTERNITKENEIPLEEIPHSLPFYKIKWKLALIIISGIILISGIIFTVVYFLKPKKKHPIESPGFPGNINMTKAKEVFSPMFKLKTEEKTLTQLSQKSLQIYNSSINGQNDSYMIFTKTIYDIYPINSTSAFEIDKNFYNNIYYTAITVNSLCSKLTKDPLNDDCELEKIFDLNQKNENTKNLRRNEEEIQDYIRQALLPICIIEHTDTNLILSSTCPETLSRNYINDIIRAFNNIKPVSYKGYDFDKDYVNTLLEEKGDKIYISSYDNVCLDPNDDQKKTIICNLTKIIITDKEGNFISNKISNSTLTQDENKLFYSNYTYEFKNIPKETSQSFNEEIYQKNLDTVFSLIEPLMQKKIYINNFTNFIFDKMTKQNHQSEIDSTSDELRNLIEETEEEKFPGVQTEKILNKTLPNIEIEYILKNDIGFGEGSTAKTITSHDINNDAYNEFSNYRIQTDLYETFNKLISISKGANNLISKLNEDLNEPLLNFMEIINGNIGELNGLLAFKDLSEIFDSTLAINDLDSLPYTFIIATENLYNSLNKLGNDLLYTIDNAKKKLKSDISIFIKNSHDLIFKLFDKLEELSELFSSNQNKIAEIQSYYLNNTDTSYYDDIQKAKDILDNYYKREKDIVLPYVNNMLDKFYQSTVDKLEKFQSQLDLISDKLDNGEITIATATVEGYQNSIKNIYNSKIKTKEIIEEVKQNLFDCINLKSNGYFETQKELDENKQSLEQKSEKAVKIAYTLDNNELIDKTFDKFMTSFRDKFIELLKYMDDSVKKFPIEENVLGSSSFDSIYLDDIDDYLKTEKINILNFIKKENDDYLKSVNNIFENFLDKNGPNMEKIISELFPLMTDLYFDNLNSAYNDSLYYSFQNIEEIINYNIKLGDEFFSQMKKAKSVHITKRFKNQYKYFFNSIKDIENFINNKFKNYLSNNYKNIINQIRECLQSIKSNEILAKYYNELPLAEKHLNSIKELFKIFDRHISDNTYNTIFLPKINNFIRTTINSLTKKEKEYKKIYNEMAEKQLNNIKYDYDVKRVEKGERYCCVEFLWWCIKHCRHKDKIYYDGYNVKATNNYEKLKSINTKKYFNILNRKYNLLYPKLSKNVLLYNSLLSDLDAKIKAKKDESYDSKALYLNNIQQKFKTIIGEKLGKNLLIASYNYFKNKITNLLPNELNDIKTQWENSYEQIYNDIITNKNKFKSSIFEFYLVGNFYQQAYSQSISYDYLESVIDKLKNEFNYTNQYYYNIITSKLNKTYSYILNNLPINEKPFNDILNIRIKEIKNSQNNILKQLINSKNEILILNKQEVILQVNSKNFFNVNDLIKNHINDFNSIIEDKLDNIGLLAYEDDKATPEELALAKFYLENSINGKQIKENYEVINNANFIDLQTDVYQKLIDENLKIEPDELIKNIINLLNKLNEKNQNDFNFEYEKYKKILLDKLYNEFDTPDNIIKKINSLYSKGINDSNEKTKNKIYNSIESVLTNITNHLKNEASRLSLKLTSYSTDFSYIQKRLNDYKVSIYNQYYSAITYAVNDFHMEILGKFYDRYINKGLKEYEKNIDDTSFGTAKFLNMSIDLDEIIEKKFKLIYITEFRNTTYNEIRYLFQKNIQNLDKLFDFKSIKNTINNTIDNIYTTDLLPILKKVGTYTPGDEGVSDYDLSSKIVTEIDDYLTKQISLTKKLMKEMEGEGYIINDIPPADFSSGKGNVYDTIKNMFTNFKMTYMIKENKEFNDVVKKNALYNFKNLMDNFITSFGIDFFNRIVKYNKIQKITSLYHNLKYSLEQTLIYYIGLSQNIEEGMNFPLDMKLKIFNLNNLDNIVKEKNNFIISTLNDKFHSYLEETKNYIINKYLNDINTNQEFDLQFNQDLKKLINSNINGNVHNYENEYIDMMKKNIKESFIQQYTKFLYEVTDDMKTFIEKSKITLKAELDNLISTESNSVLDNIQIGLNETNNIIDKLNMHFSSFKISEEINTFLDNFGENLLIPKYLEVKELLDKRSGELVLNNLEKYSNEYKSEYSLENFQVKVDKINTNFTSYFNEFNDALKNYGIIEDVYQQNLDKEIANNNRLRLLEETDINGDLKLSDVTLDIKINEIKNSSSLVKEFIQNLDLFSSFEDKIANYINEKNNQYTYTSYNLEKNKNQNDNFDLMSQRLEELNQLSTEYYSKTHNIYNILKQNIIENINKIDELINSCQKITYDIISNKYIQIKNNFNQINDLKNAEKSTINIEPYTNQQTDNYFTVETKVENYITKNKFTLDLILDSETRTPQIIGRLENYIYPKIYKIDFYSNVSQHGRIGRKIDVNFNNITSYTNIIFDAGSNKINIITNFNFDLYTIKTQYYEKKETKNSNINIGTIYNIPSKPKEVNIDTPEEEKFCEIPAKNVTYEENYFY